MALRLQRPSQRMRHSAGARSASGSAAALGAGAAGGTKIGFESIPRSVLSFLIHFL